MPGVVSIKNLTISGKLNFDDAADRTLETESITVWGLFEIGNKSFPFGENTSAVATIRLRGSVYDVQTYVYIEEQTLHNKVIAVPGRVETHGASRPDTWLRLKTAIAKGVTSACLVNVSGPVLWEAGHQIVIAPTEYNSARRAVLYQTSFEFKAVDRGWAGLRRSLL